MKTLYIDCGMGAAGDMLAAALYEILPDKKKFINKISELEIPGVEFKFSDSEKLGVKGTEFKVSVDGIAEGEHEHEHGHEHGHEHEHEHGHEHEHEHTHEHAHHHTSLKDIETIVGNFNISDDVKDKILKVYKLIAEAESDAHGKPVEEIHFHEVGAMDAVCDITICCLLFEEIGAEKIIASPVHVGAGHVHCAHGILPVPAPATAYILKGVPIYGGEIQSELCTPTGAALLKTFASGFECMPQMCIEKTGFGFGKKDFKQLNAVRVILGETENEKNIVSELSCNIDDMTSEDLAYACDVLREEGALEVYTLACNMKKGRSGFLLCVLCKEELKEKMIRLMFKHTTTIGIRESIKNRYVLERTIEKVTTPFGDLNKKVSKGYGVEREKFEHDDLKKLALEKRSSLEEIKTFLEK